MVNVETEAQIPQTRAQTSFEGGFRKDVVRQLSVRKSTNINLLVVKTVSAGGLLDTKHTFYIPPQLLLLR